MFLKELNLSQMLVNGPKCYKNGPRLQQMLSNLTSKASLATRHTLFFYTIFTPGQKEARVLKALCKS